MEIGQQRVGKSEGKSGSDQNVGAGVDGIGARERVGGQALEGANRGGSDGDDARAGGGAKWRETAQRRERIG